MKTEELKKLGLEEDIIKKVLVLHGKSTETKKADLATAQADLTAAQAEVETLQGQLVDANTQIEDFKELDVDGIQAAADDYKAKFKTAETEAKENIAKLKFDHALDGALVGAKAKNTTAVKALLNFDDMKLSEKGEVVGLDKQLEAIQKENDFLFIPDKEPPKIVTGGNNKSIIGDTALNAAREAAGLKPIKE